jgi:hypothetical protein
MPDQRTQVWGNTTHPGQFESHGNLTTDADAEFLLVLTHEFAHRMLILFYSRSQASIIDQGLQQFDEILKSHNGANLT